jgi:hypothetical protein
MPQKTASRTSNVLAGIVNCLAGFVYLLNAIATLTRWDNFVYTPRSNGYLYLALSLVFFSLGTVFMTSHHKAK